MLALGGFPATFRPFIVTCGAVCASSWLMVVGSAAGLTGRFSPALFYVSAGVWLLGLLGGLATAVTVGGMAWSGFLFGGLFLLIARPSLKTRNCLEQIATAGADAPAK
ncbi:hypothetical protein [Thermomonospora amylolytica]|uniref:hypothetical protein n=1 Tax=Thermomonospora amylolytica TaxID=1411117 RepID=UPI0013002619|nr:hypothetical protein [Thermomonospora amylolytica]